MHKICVLIENPDLDKYPYTFLLELKQSDLDQLFLGQTCGFVFLLFSSGVHLKMIYYISFLQN
jgi:hypothetical protein